MTLNPFVGVALADKLHVANGLETLSLVGNHLGDHAGVKLAHALEVNTGLRKLSPTIACGRRW